MNFVLSLLTLFFSSSLLAQSWENMLEIESRYQDEGSTEERELELRGSGFLVEAQGRVFAVTAAHVSSGNQLRVFKTKNREELLVKKSFRNDKSDFQILELQTPVPAELKLVNGTILYTGQVDLRKLKHRSITQASFLPLSRHVEEMNLDLDQEYKGLQALSIYMDPFANLLNVRNVIMPGSSGSPLLVNVDQARDLDLREVKRLPKGSIALRGLAIRRERFFPLASFIPAYKIIVFLEEILAHDEAPSFFAREATSWHLAESVLYRKQGALEETAFSSSVSSGVLLGDVGGGVSMYGGNESTLDEDEPETLLERISAYPALDQSVAPFWIMTMRSRRGALMSYPMWFDMEYRLNLPSFGFSLGFPSEPELGSISAWRRLGADSSHFKVGCKETLTYDRGKIKIDLQSSFDDELSLSFDSYGKHCENGECADQFAPLIETESPSGREYVIDTRPLYFTDFARAQTKSLKAPASSQEDFNERIDAAIDGAGAGAGLIIRPKVPLAQGRPIRLKEFQVKELIFDARNDPCFEAFD